ncbi:ABC-type lipoprotein export system, ATPase component [Butyrivibrio proteoclasticus]|uniref:ABC-type lipoprotein export system, ATPase component n=1 Tax=Butyrivibrio proteoclasticus TaxID=43305 RepID=A0A1I5QZA4_9FIRM|nr:ATP-binding cassette domain-containing protein [Butyrivibrio proteoclasticus]SFP51573.1 ABC-type lipoprotein export system, ATPase component [Butyrivibrio proteoclasticus]
MRGINTQTLWKIMQLLDSDQVESALADAFEALIADISADLGAIWLKNSSTSRINSIVSIGKNNISGFSIENKQGIVGEACEAKEPIFVSDISKDERFPGGKDEITGIEIKNVYFMPMIYRKETVGCVEIINLNRDELSEEDIALIHSFAGIITLFINENGYSYVADTKKKVVMSLRDITKDYPSGMEITHVLKGVDLDIYENELLVILGESGCGKTTLLNIIGGMDSPTNGEITLDGKDFSHPTEKELVNFRRNYIGFIFQSYNLMPNLTALENVKFISEICENPVDPAEAIDMVGLSSRANNYPSMMSGGQQQRVSIARALVKNPRIILADEPTAALDFSTGQEVLALIEEVISKRHTAVVMVTHNVEIAKMANRVIRVRDGKISSIRVNMWPLHASDLAW